MSRLTICISTVVIIPLIFKYIHTELKLCHKFTNLRIANNTRMKQEKKNTMSIYILKLNFTTRKSKYPCSFPFDKTLNPGAKQITEHDLFGCTHAWKRKKNSSNKTLTRARTRRMGGVFLPPHVRQCPRDIYTHTHTHTAVCRQYSTFCSNQKCIVQQKEITPKDTSKSQ